MVVVGPEPVDFWVAAMLETQASGTEQGQNPQGDTK